MSKEEFFGGMFGKKQEMVTYTEADLEQADIEYRAAAATLNAIDFGAEDFDERKAGEATKAYREASKKYQTIHRALYPEKYQGEHAHATILPNVEMTDDADNLIAGSELAE